MKTLICLILSSIFLSSHISAQYNKKDAVIGAGIIYMTFITVEGNGQYMSKNQIAFTSMSGMLISAGYMLYKNTDLGKKIQRRIKLKRNR